MPAPAGDRKSDASVREGRFDPEPWRAELLAFLRRAGAGAEAEDLVQETFLRALRQPPGRSARAWLYRVALNLLRDQRRRESVATRALREAARPEATADAPAFVAANRSDAEAAWRVVTRLPESQRLALYLRIRRHMDYDEIGTVLECSPATARQHFHLAVKAVRDELPGDGDE
jgi:RNA polymerase sigma-70 factor, ECF subfamily